MPGGLIIVDFGTATTFDAVTPKGEYLGGAISPGMMISTESALPSRFQIAPGGVRKARARGRPQHRRLDAERAGLRLRGPGGRHLRADEGRVGFPVKVVATGGLAPLIGGISKQIEVVDDQLTLDGLRIIYQRNQSES